MRLNELTAREAMDVAAAGATVVLPTGATEQHGPHLPLAVDHTITEAVAIGAAERAAASIPVVVAPVLPYGRSAFQFPSLSLKSSTFLVVLNDLGESLVKMGFKRIFLLSGHGGNDELARVVARDWVVSHDVAVAACSYYNVSGAVARKAGMSDLRFFPGHAGDWETAAIMALAPELVRTDRIPTKDADPPHVQYSKLRSIAPALTVAKTGEWERVGGYTDTVKNASPEWGRAMLDGICGAVAEVLVAFHQTV